MPSPIDTVAFTYRRWSVSATEMATRFPLTSSLARATALSETPWRTSRPRAGSPHTAPSAAAMGRPTMPVPGMPTPIPFLRMLPLTSTAMRKSAVCRQRGQSPQCEQFSEMMSTAFATARATAMGSVQPRAGFTSLWMSSMSSAWRSVIGSRVGTMTNVAPFCTKSKYSVSLRIR